MVSQAVLERFLAKVLAGDRLGSRAVIEDAMRTGVPANSVYMDVIWPIMVEIERLSKLDRISPAQEHLAMRISRSIVDQLQNKLPRKPVRSKKIVISCSPTEHGELGGQIIADLLESDGWDVRFLGGGIAYDDILVFVHEYRPDVLLLYGTIAAAAPEVRRLIDTVRNVNAFPDMKIMCCGGVFNRAEGLWEEIGADLFAATATEALQVAANEGRWGQIEPVRTISRRKRKQRSMVDVGN